MTTTGSWEDEAVSIRQHCSRGDGNNDRPPFSQHSMFVPGIRIQLPLHYGLLMARWKKKTKQENLGEKCYPVLKPPHLTCHPPFLVPPSLCQQHSPCHLWDMTLVTHFQRIGQMIWSQWDSPAEALYCWLQSWLKCMSSALSAGHHHVTQPGFRLDEADFFFFLQSA